VYASVYAPLYTLSPSEIVAVQSVRNQMIV